PGQTGWLEPDRSGLESIDDPSYYRLFYCKYEWTQCRNHSLDPVFTRPKGEISGLRMDIDGPGTSGIQRPGHRSGNDGPHSGLLKRTEDKYHTSGCHLHGSETVFKPGI